METKFYHYIDNSDLIRDVIEYMSEYRKDPNIKFTVLADKKYFFTGKYKKTMEYVYNQFEKAGINKSNIEFAVNEDERRFNIIEWTKFKVIDAIFTKKGINFGFEDSRKIWDIKEVETANKKIIKTADEIKRCRLTPYEKMMMAYLKVTSRKYTAEKDDEHSAESRSVYGVLNSDKIVCVGYAELLKAIIEEVDDKNIQIYRNAVACSEDGTKIDGYHANLIVRIKDEKYGIDGFYYLDPTWDSGHEGKNLPDLSYFMVPLKDIDKIKYQIRGVWVDLSKEQPKPEPAPDPDKQPERPEPKQEEVKYYEKTIKRKSDQEIFFTSDGFMVTKEFIDQVKDIDPDIIDAIKKDMSLEQRYLDKLEESKKERAQYDKIYEIIKNSELDYLSNDKKEKFGKIISDCVKTDSYDKLEDFLTEMKKDKQDFLQNFKQNLYSYLLKEHYDKNFYKLLLDSVEISKDDYEKYINSKIEKILKENPDEDIATLRKKIQAENTYEQYTELREKQIREFSEGLAPIKSKIDKFYIAVCEEFDKRPELQEHFVNLYEESYRKINTNYLYYKDTEVLDIESLVEQIAKEAEIYKTSIRNFSMNKTIDDKIRVLDISDKSLLDGLEKTKANAQDYSKYFSIDGTGMSEGIESWFKEHSEPISLSKTEKALGTILEKAHKELSDEDVDKLTHSIIERTAEKVLLQYKPTASHAIVQHAVQTKSQDGEQSE